MHVIVEYVGVCFYLFLFFIFLYFFRIVKFPNRVVWIMKITVAPIHYIWKNFVWKSFVRVSFPINKYPFPPVATAS